MGVTVEDDINEFLVIQIMGEDAKLDTFRVDTDELPVTSISYGPEISGFVRPLPGNPEEGLPVFTFPYAGDVSRVRVAVSIPKSIS